jgi:cardiolipin synthase (CMP-forming)
MTTANKVTIVRILLTPLFIVEVIYYFRDGVELHRILALGCFALAASLDGVDGYIARHFNQRSELGAILDPLADKLLLISGIVTLSLPSPAGLNLVHIPIWLTVTIISRDSIILLGMVVIHMTCGKVIVKPHVVGKVATVLQMVTVLWTLLKWNPRWLEGWSLGAAICTAGSGLLYILDGMRQLSASPKSLPTPKQ